MNRTFGLGLGLTIGSLLAAVTAPIVHDDTVRFVRSEEPTAIACDTFTRADRIECVDGETGAVSVVIVIGDAPSGNVEPPTRLDAVGISRAECDDSGGSSLLGFYCLGMDY